MYIIINIIVSVSLYVMYLSLLSATGFYRRIKVAVLLLRREGSRVYIC